METKNIVIPYGKAARQYLLGLPILFGFAWIVWLAGKTDAWPIYIVLLVLALVLSTEIETEINSQERTVLRRWNFLRFIPLRRKQQSMAEFTSIGNRYREMDGDHRTWFVHLMTRTGKRVEIKWFGDSHEFPAEAFNLQTQLSELTGLPIINDVR